MQFLSLMVLTFLAGMVVPIMVMHGYRQSRKATGASGGANALLRVAVGIADNDARGQSDEEADLHDTHHLL